MTRWLKLATKAAPYRVTTDLSWLWIVKLPPSRPRNRRMDSIELRTGLAPLEADENAALVVPRMVTRLTFRSPVVLTLRLKLRDTI